MLLLIFIEEEELFWGNCMQYVVLLLLLFVGKIFVCGWIYSRYCNAMSARSLGRLNITRMCFGCAR